MPVRIYLVILLLGWWTAASQAESARYRIELADHNPQAGDEGERTIRTSTAYNSTDTAAGQTTTSNSLAFIELKGREKVLTWDVSNNVSKVELFVEHFVDVKDSRTNELLKAGSELAGNSLAGESFFRLRRGSLSSEVQGQLDKSYNLCPLTFHTSVTKGKLPPTVAVGEAWQLSSSFAPEELRAFGLAGTNGVDHTGQLVALTNFCGIDCFHIRSHVASTNTPDFVKKIFGPRAPVKIDMQVRLTIDLIVPVDASQRILSQSVLIEVTGSSELGGGDRPKAISQSRLTTKMLDEFRPLSHPARDGTNRGASTGETGN